jgi:hypothetical protein
VYVRQGGAWQNAGASVKLTAADLAAAAFGSAVALSRDDSTAVVSGHFAFGSSGQPLEPGAAYAFSQPAGGWTSASPTATLTATDGQPGDFLGLAVAASGDGTTVVAGAEKPLGFPGIPGEVYTFVRPGTRWASRTESAAFRANDAAAGDTFGGGVAMTADASTLAITRSLDAAVYIFTATGCIPSATTLCIDDQPGDSRFQIAATFSSSAGSGSAQAVPLSSLGITSGGIFWFFGASNPEILIKVLDGCAVDGGHWVFFAATTNVGFDLTVTDTRTGRQRTYANASGTAAAPVQDTAAFACP